MNKKIVVIICILILTVTASATLSEAFNLPDTGQTKCYRGVSPYDEIPCTGTGQDGEYNINPMSFTDNSNGTVTDNNTGFMWQKCSAGQNNDAACSGTAVTYNWYQASGTYDATYNPSSQDVCGSLELGGYSDWRLPTKKELITIVDYGIPYPGPTINTTFFPNTKLSYYWSSSTFAYNPDNAWDVYFDYGYVSFNYKHYYYSYVRCVRGGQSAESFVKNGDGTVTDNKTGLVWQQGEPGYMTWDSALSYCEGLSLGGNIDWRLPNIKELESITDDTRYNPAIDTTFFPSAYASFYWSSTTYAFFPDVAWYVDFYYGFVSCNLKPNNYYVRCVRGGQSGSFDYCCDGDNDGYINSTISGNCTGSGCVPVGCQTAAGSDCNDNDPLINPGATEICDSKDNDCDGQIDEGGTCDLIVSSITSPTTGIPGSTINITDTTKNQGTGTASASTTKLYWSTNSTWDAGDTYLGARPVPDLAAGTTNSGSTTVTVPAGTCSGTFYIIAKADADNVVAEGTKEINNTKYKTIKAGPDLIISTLTAPTTSGAGKTISVTDMTKNQGGCPAVASTTKLYFSTNSAWDAGDTSLGERAIPALAEGATNTGSTSVTIPAVATGTYYIIAKADANAVVTETSETNNKKSKSIKIGPDLIVSLITAPTSAVRGSTISVTDTTKNNGGGDAVASTTKLYLSTNTTWDAGDTYLGSRSVPLLVAGASSAGSTSVTIPTGIATGPYYIIALTDDGNVVVETNETNNEKTKAITINP